MVRFTLRNAATAVSDVQFSDEGQVRYVFLPDGAKSWTAFMPICSNCDPKASRTLTIA